MGCPFEPTILHTKPWGSLLHHVWQYIFSAGAWRPNCYNWPLLNGSMSPQNPVRVLIRPIPIAPCGDGNCAVWFVFYSVRPGQMTCRYASIRSGPMILFYARTGTTTGSGAPQPDRGSRSVMYGPWCMLFCSNDQAERCGNTDMAIIHVP